MQEKTVNSFKKGRVRAWIGCSAILLTLPFLLYFGYCWGLWGRNFLVLQYFFQCSCPPSSEEARFSKQIDIVVSACEPVKNSRLSPSGRFLYVYEENSGVASAYLLDLQTSERIPVNDQPFSSFITDDLWFLERGLDDYILDPISGTQAMAPRFVYSRPDAQINGETNLALLAESFRQADEVYLLGAGTDKAVALANDPFAHPERNFIVEKYDVPDFDTERFLRENNIPYQTILPDNPHEVVSPDKKLIARDDGIYFLETNHRIIKVPPFSVRGWTNDGQSLIYSVRGRCLVPRGLPFGDDFGCQTWVPQPIIKVKIPKEYLSLNGVQ